MNIEEYSHSITERLQQGAIVVDHVDRLVKARESLANLLNYFGSTFKKK